MNDYADLILENASIITCDSTIPEAEAIAIKNEFILKIGSNRDIQAYKNKSTKVIDCQGKTLVPGFNDAHCHVFSLINRLFALDLSPQSVKSINDIQESIRRKVRYTPPGRWISGSAYNEFYLVEKRHPTRFDLDEVSPHNPVLLFHRSSHAMVLNSLAMKMVGINNETEEPEGGIIERDLEIGEPNGVLFEMSRYISDRTGPVFSDSEKNWALDQVNEIYLSNGITSLGEASVSNDFERWQDFQKIKAANRLKSRVFFMFGPPALPDFIKTGMKTGTGDFNLRLGSLKIVLSEAKGKLQPSQVELNNLVFEACRSGYQVAIHAVETTTVEAAIIALEHARERLPGTPTRNRIEHCSECPPAFRKRLAGLGAVAVSQPPFLFFSGERYLVQVAPESQEYLYPFKSLLNDGVRVAGSSDSPVVSNNPLIGIYSAVTRKAESGQIVLSQEVTSLKQALEMYTLNGAFASREENIKGTLIPGKLADIVMLNSNLLKIGEGELKEVKVEKTILGGKIVWST